VLSRYLQHWRELACVVRFPHEKFFCFFLAKEMVEMRKSKCPLELEKRASIDACPNKAIRHLHVARCLWFAAILLYRQKVLLITVS
jgi:hypothetical protein